MKVLITGASGFIGSRLIEHLLNKGTVDGEEIEIAAIDNLSGGHFNDMLSDRFYLSSQHKFHQYDTTSADNMNAAFAIHHPDIVYHLSAYAAEGLSPFIRRYNYQQNLIATANIVNHCIKYGVKRLVFTSSMAVYGDQEAPFTEEMMPYPKDPYGIAKAASERDIQIAGEQHGLEWCIIRPHNVYGINQNIKDPYRNVIGIWINKIKEGQNITIYGNGEQTRAFSYIDDCLEPFVKCGMSNETANEIFNIGGTVSYSIQEAAEIVRDVIMTHELFTGNQIDIEYLEPRFEVKHAIPSYQKSIDILQYEDTTSLQDGVKNMWEWVMTNSNINMLQPPATSEYEIENNIYDYWKR